MGKNIGYIPTMRGVADNIRNSIYAGSGWQSPLEGFRGTQGLDPHGTQGFDPSSTRSSGNNTAGSSGLSNSGTSQTQAQPLPTPISSTILQNIQPTSPINTATIPTSTSSPMLTAGTPALGIASRARPNAGGLFIAWTSLNMDAGSCRIVGGSGQVYAQSTEGAQLITTLISGQLVSLTCTSRGQTYRASATP